MNAMLEKTLSRTAHLSETAQVRLARVVDGFLEQEAYDARTLQGLAEAEKGEGVSVEEARTNMEEFLGRAVRP